MTGQRHVSIAAAGATFLAAAPLAAVFRTYSWTFYAAGAVIVVLATALLTRSLRLATWAQVLSMAGAHTVLLTWLFGEGTGFLGTIPTPGTAGRFADMLSQALTDTRTLAAPVPDTEGLLFTVAASIGGVAILVDVLTVTWRRPAVTGLPMLAIYSVPVAVLTDSVSWISFGFAAAGFLWLLIADHVSQVRSWGRRFSDDGRDVDAWERSPLSTTGRRLGLISITAAVLIPLAVPGITVGFLGELVTGTRLGAGPGRPGGAVDPITMLRGNLQRSEVVDVLEVITNDRYPGYLRLAVADKLTERGAAPGDPDNDQVLVNRTLRLYPETPENARTWTAKVRVTGLDDSRYLPIYPNTTQVELDDGNRWRYDDLIDVAWSPGDLQRGTEYLVTYQRHEYTAEELRDAARLDRTDRRVRYFTEVPNEPIVENLVEKLIKGERTQYDKVMEIHDHFSEENGFSYALSTDEGTSGSDLVDFLRNKQGFCQQYAIAMTWMVRAAGIPARVAIGFTQGEPTSDGFIIRSKNAHAWVEVYFPGFGWVPFDPTPAAGVDRPVPMGWAPNPFRPEETSPDASATPGPSTTSSLSPTRRDRQDGGGDVQAAGSNPQPPARWPYWVLAGLVAVALGSSPGLHRWWRRRRRLASGASPGRDPHTTANAAWDELLDTLVDLDIGYQPSDTPRGVTRRLRDVRPPLIESSVTELRLLARAVEQARYAPQPLPSGDLGRAVGAVSAELRATTTQWVRLRAQVLPSSVVRDWHRSVTALRDRVLDGWRQWRERTPGQATTRQGSTPR